MEEMLKAIGVVWVLILLSLFFYQYKRMLNFYQELGTEIVSYFPLKAILRRGKKKIYISTFYTLTLKIKIPISGYLSLEKMWFKGDFLFFMMTQSGQKSF